MEPITWNWLASIGFLPDDNRKPTWWSAKIWDINHEDDYGKHPAMHLLWSSIDGSCHLEAYGLAGETLCIVELKRREDQDEWRSLCKELGIRTEARI